MKLWAGIIAAGLVVSVVPGIARAQAEPSGVRLETTSATASWRGAFENVAVPSPQACTSGACDEFVVDLGLRRGALPRGGRIVVAIDRVPAVVDQLYNLDLYVYGPDGSLAGASTNGYYMPSEAASIANPTNGKYRIVVVPTTVVGRTTYRGFVSVERGPSRSPRRDLLPNLVTRRPTNVQLQSAVSATPLITFDRGVRMPTSCNAAEIAEGRQRCLRFDQSVANLGSGPLELRYRDEADNRMRQRIFRSDGSFYDRVAGNIEFHAVHAHFHYAGFMQSAIYRARSDGSKGTLVRQSAKQGFCMVDVLNVRFAQRGTTGKRYDFPGVCDGTARDEKGLFTWAGISPGWADIYPWNYADQYIDVAGVPDGRYVLELRSNVDGILIETTVDDNASSVVIEIRGDVARVVS